jgi:predicted ATPase
VRSERELKIAPLGLPDGDSVEAVTASPAVEMFLDRADAAGASLTATPETAATVASICRRLDGLPLAIELAAARVGLLGPSAILDRLGTGELDAGPRDLPERQRTMTATLDWSHDLLDAGEQSLFAQLAVFSGGFSLDAVEAVADGDGVVARLGALVDQSLVLRAGAPQDRPRFRLLEPVRQYAVGRLQASGLATATADRHADHVHRTALAAREDLRGPALVGCLDRLEADHANLRSGFLRLVETGRTDEAATLMENLWLYLALRGHAREGLGWLARLDQDRLGDRGRCEALTCTAGLAFVTGDIPRMHEAARPALLLARDLGVPALHVQAAILAGHAAVFTLDPDEAGALLDEALRAAAASGDRWATAHTHLGQGQLVMLGGDLTTADAVLTAAEREAREIGNAFTLATTLNNRATVTALRAEHATTAALLAESVELSVAAGIGWTLSYAVPALAGVAVGLHQGESAAFLFGASASLSAAHAADPSFPVSSDLSHQDLVTARGQLDEETFRRSWDAGRAATNADIAELARQLSARARG